MKSKIRYNKKLLPNKKFKIISKIKKLDGYYLIRLPGKKIWYVQKNEHFSELISVEEYGRGVSMNLLSIYRHKDARIRPKGKVKDAHHQPWNETDDSIAPPFLSYRKKANFFGIKIEDVSNLHIESVDVIFKNPNNIPDPNFAAYLKVLHRPTKCNYWHFELQSYLKNSSGDDIEINTCNNISNKNRARLMKVIGEAFAKEISKYLVHSSQCNVKYLPKSIYKS